MRPMKASKFSMKDIRHRMLNSSYETCQMNAGMRRHMAHVQPKPYFDLVRFSIFIFAILT